jgi:hypothetical protein
MTRLHLLLTLAGLTGAAATVAPTSPQSSSPTLPAAGIAPSIATGVPANGQPDVAWLARYGAYNARQGSWNFMPNPHGGC